MRLDLNVDHMFERNYYHRLAWHRASTDRSDQYRSDLEYKFSTLLYDKGALQCKNAMCKKQVNELSRLYNEILSMCIKASECIPATCPKLNSGSAGGRRKVPGWSKEVEHLMQEALFRHRQCRSMRKPHKGNITEMRCITRDRYHMTVRHIMREGDRMCTTKMAEVISENRTRDL